MNKAQHPLERAVEGLATVVEHEPKELKVWAVAALAHRLDLPVLVGDDALGEGRCTPDDERPRYAVDLVLSDPRDIYLESGDVLDLADGVERVGGAWVGLAKNLMDRHPEKREDILRAAYQVIERLVGAVRERGLTARSRSRPRSRPERCESSS